jgi:predicted CoA-substrate-specific enzyme activase
MNERYVGLDLGSTYTKLVELEEHRIVDSRIVKSAKKEELVPDIRTNLCTTGYFRKKVKAEASITEITAAVLGAKHYFPECDVIVDIGGQDIKVTDVRDNRFYINDKCSAGTGAFFEFILSYLDLNYEAFANLEESSEIFYLNNTCTVFALSEIISHMANGADVNAVLTSLNYSFAKKISEIVPACRKLVLIGGVAKNAGFVKAFRNTINAEVLIPDEPQTVNALGAALYIQGKKERGSGV